MSEALDIQKVMRAVDNLRKARDDLKARYQAEDNLLSTHEEQFRALIMHHLNATKSNSVTTDYGTAYRKENVRASVENWNDLWQWAKTTDCMTIFPRRVSSQFVKEYMDTTNGELPPGVKVHTDYDLVVRRPTTG